MKRYCFLLFCLCVAFAVSGNNPLRTTPYPQENDDVFLNPAPLLVPPSMRDGELLQFNLSRSKRFNGTDDMLSEPVRWGVFNAHRVLQKGTWYWRFRSVDKDGKKHPWSKVYRFTIGEDVPEFAAPPFDVFRKNLPVEWPRIYCFLEDGMEEARRNVRSHPEFWTMVDDARRALAMDFRTDTVPYKHVFAMSENCDNLHTAWRMQGRDLYIEKMMQNVRCLLPEDPTEQFVENDFNAGELVYLLACTYDVARDRFTAEERKRIETLILHVMRQYCNGRLMGRLENRFYDEHIWQFTVRRLMQGALVLYDKYPEAEEYLEYLYEAWTSRAPASGFNRDGSWHNGANYFSANAVSLMYLPSLLGYVTGVDFLQHPWYRNAGKGIAYTWLPGSLSDGFGDGHEKMNKKPLRIRSAFADFLARETGDPYAEWYSSLNDSYKEEFETRLYRMACGKPRTERAELPDSAPKAVWFRDCGEMVANSDLHDLKRNVSLSFRSSPFGSGNHTHSCQNAFNLHYGGEAVYHAAGHYMKFNDPHNLLSYRNTRAYNTVLVNGIGQPFTPEARGRIVRMMESDRMAYALGDASDAYCGVSDICLWKESFEKYGLEQSPENGFGDNPLTKYRRHILMLYPNIVIVYDELEASEEVCWDWLLHSPVKFGFDNGTFVTERPDKGFRSVGHIWGSVVPRLVQTDKYAASPSDKDAQRGEDFTPQWTMTAAFDSCRKCHVLAVMQVEADGMKAVDVKDEGGSLTLGDWKIEAELDAEKAPRLSVCNLSNGSSFSYGEDPSGASVISDTVDGKLSVNKMTDQHILWMGKW